MMNLTIFTKSTPHALRALSLATFAPAFTILLISGIMLEQVNPAIGILPLFFSAAFAALLLANERRCGCQASGLAGTPLHFIADFVLGVGLAVCLVLAWVFVGSRRRHGIVLAVYGTNFLICNLLIHGYFVWTFLRDAVQGGQTYPASCPQCQGGSFSFTVGGYRIGRDYSFGGGLNGGMKNGYAPLLDGDGEPRVSTDEGADGAASMV
ncbi:hypothetical protein C7974DRAFT_182051 [Boeremia exigua]|uniref:uncharacterized protein n=1 Tax=Boeremia exigua TaxID=749465 RepID=UPI001E8DA6D1|nr:uncharacterized protein C7974DRAFT_182051 [Boeremia exigua]KAH6629148.1 hypothetical protein C7974DRAFT_182051 [Boeremia exigua]